MIRLAFGGKCGCRSTPGTPVAIPGAAIPFNGFNSSVSAKPPNPRPKRFRKARRLRCWAAIGPAHSGLGIRRWLVELPFSDELVQVHNGAGQNRGGRDLVRW